MQNQRFRIFREHKYMISVLCDLLISSAKVDFTDKQIRTQFREQLTNMRLLWKSHADNEEARIIPLLKQHNSNLWEKMLGQHVSDELILTKVEKLIDNMDQSDNKHKIHEFAYALTLELRHYVVASLEHFDFEEQIIMPELQRLLPDETIKSLHHISYELMLPEQLVHMMEVLFPHMNIDDQICYLSDIRNAQPQKFDAAWAGIAWVLPEEQRNKIANLMNINIPEPLTSQVEIHYPWEKAKSDNSELASEYHKG